MPQQHAQGSGEKRRSSADHSIGLLHQQQNPPCKACHQLTAGCADLSCGGVWLDGCLDAIAVQLLHVELCVFLQAAGDNGHTQLLRGGVAVACMVLVTAWHNLCQALDYQGLLVLWAVEQQQSVVATAWGAALLLICAATVTACSNMQSMQEWKEIGCWQLQEAAGGSPHRMHCQPLS